MLLLFKTLLAAGDSFVDVGANVGMFTLMAARRVGTDGRVEAFEPNPQAFDRLREAVQLNRLDHVRLHPLGLSDAPATLTLSVPGRHTGAGTLATLTPQQEAVDGTAHHQVAVVPGDAVLLDQLRPGAPLAVKIDVEGFEARVIGGLRHTLERHQPAVITEVVAKHLARAHSSVEQVFDSMEALGYRSLEMGTRRVRLKHRLWIKPVQRAQCYDQSNGAWNVLWLRPGGVHEQRVQAAIGRGEIFEH